MIDLKKADLLEALLQLPYDFVTPDTLFEDEWLCLTDAEKQTLQHLGLEVRSLPGELVQRAGSYFNDEVIPSHLPEAILEQVWSNDCFALTGFPGICSTTIPS